MDTAGLTPDTTRASLLLRLKPDSPAREVAWVEFHDLYAPIIAAFARRFGARTHDIDDLVQEVLRSFFAASPEFSYDPACGRFRGYLKTCVWRKMRDMAAHQSRESAALRSFPVADAQTIEDTWNDVWETERLHRSLDIVRARYAATPERQKTFRAFEMCSLLERSTSVVAHELEMTEESVRQARSRVSRALREAFDTFDETTG